MQPYVMQPYISLCYYNQGRERRRPKWCIFSKKKFTVLALVIIFTFTLLTSNDCNGNHEVLIVHKTFNANQVTITDLSSIDMKLIL